MDSKKLLFRSASEKMPTIGVVVPFFWTGRSIKLLVGIQEAAQEFHVNLIFFQGYYCSHAYFYHKNESTFETEGNIIFDLIDNEVLDGLILYTGTFRTLEDKLKLLELCSKYKPLPMISIGSALDGITNILTDNDCGIRNMMNHLIHYHKMHRIGFIRGPSHHVDADQRLQTYKDILNENNITIKQDWISPAGIWNNTWPGQAAKELLEKINFQLDALMCVNDIHAKSIIEMLSTMNIDVPQQIAVVGYNNELEAQACNPAISTIDLNLYDRGWYAVKALSEYCEGTPLPDKLLVNAPLVIRQSCGCLTNGCQALNAISDTDSKIHFTENRRDLLLEKVKTGVLNALDIKDRSKFTQWSVDFVNCFMDSTSEPGYTEFVSRFSRLLRFFSNGNNDLGVCHWAINVINSNVSSLFDESVQEKALYQVEKARLIVCEIAEGENDIFLKRVEERNSTMNSLGLQFNGMNKIEAILDMLADHLPKMGIPACYLSLYENREKPLEMSRIILAYNKKGRIELPKGGGLFPTRHLIPKDVITVDQFRPLIIEPLYYGDIQLGFTLFEFGTQERSFYELFPAQLSAALWGSILFKKEQRTEATLENQAQELVLSNFALRERAEELECTYTQLSQDQKQLLITEKMASFGKLTAGIAHEMNTPLAAVRASLLELKTLAEEYRMSINDSEITPEDHRMIARDIINSAALAKRAAERASGFIKSIKAQTREGTVLEKQVFNLVDIVNNVLVFLKPLQTQINYKVITNYAEKKIMLFGIPEKMTQVLTNMITNSVEAVQSIKEKVINIDLSKNDKTVTIKITDNGVGISEENVSRIFDPMFSTKPFRQGIGMGLSVVHDIICEEFRGSIDVESTIGYGTTFFLNVDGEI